MGSWWPYASDVTSSAGLQTRLGGYVVGLGLVLLTALPVLGPAHRDSFPLSTYPMFARRLESPTVYFVERVDKQGRGRRLTPEQVSGNEVMQSFRTIKKAVHAGPEAVDELCRSIGERLAKREKREKFVHLRVVGARFEPVAYFTEDAPPEERTTEGSCRVRVKR
jgi:hypothetical protein